MILRITEETKGVRVGGVGKTDEGGQKGHTSS